MAVRVEPPEDLEAELDELEHKLERLRVLYEQYFIGVEKRVPSIQQREVVRLVRRIGTYQIRNTAHKFRYSSIVQRFNVHRAYWQRTTREIEEGTYVHHHRRYKRRNLVRHGEEVDNAELAKRAALAHHKGMEAVEERLSRQHTVTPNPPAQRVYLPAVARRKKRRRKRATAQLRGTPAEQLTGSDSPGTPPETASPATASAASTTPARTSPAPEQPARAPLAAALKRVAKTTRGASWDELPASLSSAALVLDDAGMSRKRAQLIHEQFVKARRKHGQPVDGITFEAIMVSMARQVPKVKAAHHATEVDFEVVEQDQKVYLKPKPK